MITAVSSTYYIADTDEEVLTITGTAPLGKVVQCLVNATSVVAKNLCLMEGTFTPTADGTFTARFASEVANSAITAKGGSSVCYYQQLN